MVFKALPNLFSYFSPTLNSHSPALELNASASLTFSSPEPCLLAFTHPLSLRIFLQPLMHCLTPIQVAGLNTPEVSALFVHHATVHPPLPLCFQHFAYAEEVLMNEQMNV